jgi:hypothetical protein
VTATLIGMRSLRSITYASRPRPDLRESDVAELALFASRRNRELRVTGCLWYHPRLFVQILEGEPETVGTLYARIIADGRHEHVTLIDDAPMEERRFGRWGFQMIRVTRELDDAGLQRLASELVGRKVYLDARAKPPALLERVLCALRSLPLPPPATPAPVMVRSASPSPGHTV